MIKYRTSSNLSCRSLREGPCTSENDVFCKGMRKSERSVCPPILNAATPVGAASMQSLPSISFMQFIRYDFPVPAEPQTIIRSGLHSKPLFVNSCGCERCRTLISDCLEEGLNRQPQRAPYWMKCFFTRFRYKFWSL